MEGSMTISGKGLAIADWIVGWFPLIVVIGIGGATGLAMLIAVAWTVLFTFLGIKAWRSSNYPRRY